MVKLYHTNHSDSLLVYYLCLNVDSDNNFLSFRTSMSKDTTTSRTNLQISHKRYLSFTLFYQFLSPPRVDYV